MATVAYVLVGKVEGQKDMYFTHRYLDGQRLEHWTEQFFQAEFFEVEERAKTQLDFIDAQMDRYHGKDRKTGRRLINDLTKRPIPVIDIPLHIYVLLRLNDSRSQGKIIHENHATIFVTPVVLDNPEHFLEVEGVHPAVRIKPEDTL